MGILGLGVSFRRAPVELLERLAFDDDDLTKAYRHAQDLDGLNEVVILSTCNRVEAYGNVPSYHSGFIALKRVLVETRGIGYEELTDPLYAHWERDATDHLFSVAAGLDSMVLGETQIQGQVRQALRRAETEGTAGPTLDAVFPGAGNPHFFADQLDRGLRPWKVPQVWLSWTLEPNHFQDITGFMETKLAALGAHRSQVEGNMLGFFDQWLPAEAEEAGKRIGVQHAEGFRVLDLE